MTYGQHGTTHLLKPNLERHLKSASHLKCLEIETGEPVAKKQKTVTEAFGNSKIMAENALVPLLHASLYIARKEKPYE